MVGNLTTNDDVHDVHLSVGTTSHTGVDDALGRKVIDERQGTHCGINFADATLHGHNLIVTDASLIEREAAIDGLADVA